jgi:hypothetical protein
LVLWYFIFVSASQKNKEQGTVFKLLLNIPLRKKLLNTFYICYTFILFLFVIFLFPVVNSITGFLNSDSLIKRGANKIIFTAGLEIPYVFNKIDLSLGNQWFVLYKEGAEGKRNLVPFVGENGNRLNYQQFNFLWFGNHNSDFLYFGNSLVYRRKFYIPKTC